MKNNDKSVISPISENIYHSDGCLKLKASSIFYMSDLANKEEEGE